MTGRRTQIFHLIFTQPRAHLLVHPCNSLSWHTYGEGKKVGEKFGEPLLTKLQAIGCVLAYCLIKIPGSRVKEGLVSCVFAAFPFTIIGKHTSTPPNPSFLNILQYCTSECDTMTFQVSFLEGYTSKRQG